jgi:hypothetical protein
LKGTPYEHINGRVLVLTAERDHNYGRLQAALSQLADVEVKRAEVVAERDGWKIACEAAQKVARDNEAELAEARRQIDELQLQLTTKAAYVKVSP